MMYIVLANLYVIVFPMIVQSYYHHFKANPPQIATEGFALDLSSERSPELNTKSLEKSKQAKVIFLA